MKMKTNVKSNIIYSPQNYLEALTGKCYIIHGREPVLKQVCRILKENNLPAKSYPLKDTVRAVRFKLQETEKALSRKGNYVLVSCCDVSKDLVPYEEYRWFRVPDNFEECG